MIVKYIIIIVVIQLLFFTSFECATITAPNPTPFNIGSTGTKLSIIGSGFDANAPSNHVVLDAGNGVLPPCTNVAVNQAGTQLICSVDFTAIATGTTIATSVSVGGTTVGPVNIAKVVSPITVATSVFPTNKVASTSTKLTILGSNFDAIFARNSVSLVANSKAIACATGSIAGAQTQLICDVNISAVPTGSTILATIVVGGVTFSNIEVATVTGNPVVTSTALPTASSFRTFTIVGYGFSPIGNQNTIVFTEKGAAGPINCNGAAPNKAGTQITCTLAANMPIGKTMEVCVTSFGSTCTKVDIVSIVKPDITVQANAAPIARTLTRLSIVGTNFENPVIELKINANALACKTPTVTATLIVCIVDLEQHGTKAVTATVTSNLLKIGPIQQGTVVEPPQITATITPQDVVEARTNINIVANGINLNGATNVRFIASAGGAINCGAIPVAATTITCNGANLQAFAAGTVISISVVKNRVTTPFKQIATVFPIPSITPAITNVAKNANEILISGTHFYASSITSVSITPNGLAAFVCPQLVVLTTQTLKCAGIKQNLLPLANGLLLRAHITSFATNTAPANVGTIAPIDPVVTITNINYAAGANLLTVTGTGFTNANANNVKFRSAEIGDIRNCNVLAGVGPDVDAKFTCTVSIPTQHVGNTYEVQVTQGAKVTPWTKVGTIVQPATVTAGAIQIAVTSKKITILGANFETGITPAKVTFNGGAVCNSFIGSTTATKIVCSIGAANFALGGVQSRVTSHGGQAVATTHNAVAASTLTATAARKYGTNSIKITITGTNFVNNANAVVFTPTSGATPSCTITSSTTSSIECAVSLIGTGLGNLKATVTTLGGITAERVIGEVVVAPTSVQDLQQRTAVANNAKIVIKGTNFVVGQTTVALNNGLNCGGINVQATTIECNVNANGKPISSDIVATVTSAATVLPSVRVSHTVAVPAITNTGGTAVAVSAGKLTITGTGFVGIPQKTGFTFTGAPANPTCTSIATSTALQVVCDSDITTQNVNQVIAATITGIAGINIGPINIATTAAATLSITSTSTSVAKGSTTVTITGSGFSNGIINTDITLTGGAGNTNIPCAALPTRTFTTLVCTVNIAGFNVGDEIKAALAKFGQNVAATKVASVVGNPTITTQNNGVSFTATKVTITGSGFDASLKKTDVLLRVNGAAKACNSFVVTPTATTIICNTPTLGGAHGNSVTAQVTSFGFQVAQTQVQLINVATISNNGATLVATHASTFTITGTNFQAAGNTAKLSIASAVGQQLPFTITTQSAVQIVGTTDLTSAVGALFATVTSFGGDVSKQVGTITESITIIPSTSPKDHLAQKANIKLTIVGKNFPAGVAVAFTPGAIVCAAPVRTATSVICTVNLSAIAVGTVVTTKLTGNGMTTNSVRVASVVQPVSITAGTFYSQAVSRLSISGANFNSIPSLNSVTIRSNPAPNTQIACTPVLVLSNTLVCTPAANTLTPANALQVQVVSAGFTTPFTAIGQVAPVMTVVQNLQKKGKAITLVTITGTNFATTAADNVVMLTVLPNTVVACGSQAPTATKIVCTVAGLVPGTLKASVSTYGAAPVVETVHEIVADPTITSSTEDILITRTKITIKGTGFKVGMAVGDVTLSSGGTPPDKTQFTFSAQTATSFVVTMPANALAGVPLDSDLTAIVLAFDTATSPVQIGFVRGLPEVTVDTVSTMPLYNTAITIIGKNFNPISGLNKVDLQGGALLTCTNIVAVSTTKITCKLGGTVANGNTISARVITRGATGVTFKQILKVVNPTPTVIATPNTKYSFGATKITVTGTNFQLPASAVNLKVNGVARVCTHSATTQTSVVCTIPAIANPDLEAQVLTASVTAFGVTTSVVTIGSIAKRAIIVPSSMKLAKSATLLTITGANFNPAIPKANVDVKTTIAPIAAIPCIAISGTPTTSEVVCKVDLTAIAVQDITAQITSFGATALGFNVVPPVKVATVVATPVITAKTTFIARNTQNIVFVIEGTGFSSVAADVSKIELKTTSGKTISCLQPVYTPTKITCKGFITNVNAHQVVQATVTVFSGKSTTKTIGTIVDPPTVIASTATLAPAATRLTIFGTNFDTPSGVTVSLKAGASTIPCTLNNGVAPLKVTQLVCTALNIAAITPGTKLMAEVSSSGTKTANVQVGLVVAPPTVTQSAAQLQRIATTITIKGTNFGASTSPANVVIRKQGAGAPVVTCTGIVVVSPQELHCTTATLGNIAVGDTIDVSLFTNGVTIPRTAIGTVINPKPTIIKDTDGLAKSATSIVIKGTGFSGAVATADVVFTASAGTAPTCAAIPGQTVTSVTCTINVSTLPAGTLLTATVKSFGTTSAAQQVSTITENPQITVSSAPSDLIAIGVTTITINGQFFSKLVHLPNAATLAVSNGAPNPTCSAVTGTSGTQLRCTTDLSNVGTGTEVKATVISHGGSSVQARVAAVVQNPEIIKATTAFAKASTTKITINARGIYDPPTANSFSVFIGASQQQTSCFNLQGVTATGVYSCTVDLSAANINDVILAQITSFGVQTPKVQVGVVSNLHTVTKGREASIGVSSTKVIVEGTFLAGTTKEQVTFFVDNPQNVAPSPAAPTCTAIASVSASSFQCTIDISKLTVGVTVSASVTKNGIASNVAAVGTLVADPTVAATPSIKVPFNSKKVTIKGSNFDTSGGLLKTEVILKRDATVFTCDTLVVASSTQLECTATIAGGAGQTLRAQINSVFYIVTNEAIIGSTINPTPVVTVTTSKLGKTANKITISGSGFNPALTIADITFSTSAGTQPTCASVAGVTATSITCTLNAKLLTESNVAAIIKVKVKSYGSETADTQVAVVVADPVVTKTALNVDATHTKLTITGTGFDASLAANNKVNLRSSVAAVVVITATTVNAGGTQLVINFTPAQAGTVYFASVAAFGTTSNNAQVAIQKHPSVTVTDTSALKITTSVTTLTITGSGFDPVAANNVVVLSNNLICAGLTGAVTTKLKCTVDLSAIVPQKVITGFVTAFGVSSGSKSIATVVNKPVITASGVNKIAKAQVVITINGANFPTASTAPNFVGLTIKDSANAVIACNDIMFLGSSAMSCKLVTTPAVGPLKAKIEAFGFATPEIQVAVMVTAPTVTAKNAPAAHLCIGSTKLTIFGTDFSTNTAFVSVTFSTVPVIGSIPACGTMKIISKTQIECTVDLTPYAVNTKINAKVTSNSFEVAVTQVAIVIANPTITKTTTNVAHTATQIIGSGTNFDLAAGLDAHSIILSTSTGSTPSCVISQLTQTGFKCNVNNLAGIPQGSIIRAKMILYGFATPVVDIAIIGSEPTLTATIAPLNSFAKNAKTLTMIGTGFDASTLAHNSVSFIANTLTFQNIVSATSTKLVANVQVKAGTAIGTTIFAVVAVNGAKTQPTVAGVEVATIVAAPTVIVQTGKVLSSVVELTIRGTGFNSIDGQAANNKVILSSGSITPTCVPKSATTTTIVCANIKGLSPQHPNLMAEVESFGGKSNKAQIATITAQPTIVASDKLLAIGATALTISGNHFEFNQPANNIITFVPNTITCEITKATETELLCTSLKGHQLGAIKASVTSYGISSGNPVLVATVVENPTITKNIAQIELTEESLIITGTNFDGRAAYFNEVVLNSGRCDVVLVTSTSITCSLSSLTEGILTAQVTARGFQTQPVQVGDVKQEPKCLPGSGGKPCLPCAPGSFQPNIVARGTACITCPTQQVQSKAGSTSCDVCADGRIADEKHITCTGIRFCNQGTAGVDTCTPCAAGTHQPSDRAQVSACSPCPAGTIAPGTGTVICDTCKNGQSPNAAKTQCTAQNCNGLASLSVTFGSTAVVFNTPFSAATKLYKSTVVKLAGQPASANTVTISATASKANSVVIIGGSISTGTNTQQLNDGSNRIIIKVQAPLCPDDFYNVFVQLVGSSASDSLNNSEAQGTFGLGGAGALAEIDGIPENKKRSETAIFLSKVKQEQVASLIAAFLAVPKSQIQILQSPSGGGSVIVAIGNPNAVALLATLASGLSNPKNPFFTGTLLQNSNIKILTINSVPGYRAPVVVIPSSLSPSPFPPPPPPPPPPPSSPPPKSPKTQVVISLQHTLPVSPISTISRTTNPPSSTSASSILRINFSVLASLVITTLLYVCYC